MKVPFNDLSRQNLPFYDKYKTNLKKLFINSNFILGNATEKFELEFAKYLNIKYCIGVNSGTDALYIILLALGIKEGDEVIVPAFTFTATISPIILIGARPVLVDTYRKSPTINIEEIENKITKKTKAIVVVDLFGHVVDVVKLKKIAKKYKIKIIEDACQAHGSSFMGKKAGTYFDVAYFSFYPGKNLGAIGDAGAIVTNNSSLANKFYRIRNHGSIKKYVHHEIGINSRLDAVQAIILSLKLKHLDSFNKLRKQHYDYYAHELKGLPIEYFSSLSNSHISNNHLMVVLVKDRNRLHKYLKGNRIECLIHYPEPIHLNKIFKKLNYKKGDFPNSEYFANNILSLPFFPEIKKKELDYVVEKTKKFYSLRT